MVLQMFDDMEIELLEDKTKLLGRKEELIRDWVVARVKNRDCQERVTSLQEQLDQIRRDSLNQLRLLSVEINAIEISIQQVIVLYFIVMYLP